mmetsp:Transcript_31593/g.78228  ORF Transcript_31593/g.78228 Transcript_31593/m.78228 type:complete len:747 (-) Transcript_31593:735-2975(-)
MIFAAALMVVLEALIGHAVSISDLSSSAPASLRPAFIGTAGGWRSLGHTGGRDLLLRARRRRNQHHQRLFSMSTAEADTAAKEKEQPPAAKEGGEGEEDGVDTESSSYKLVKRLEQERVSGLINDMVDPNYRREDYADRWAKEDDPEYVDSESPNSWERLRWKEEGKLRFEDWSQFDPKRLEDPEYSLPEDWSAEPVGGRHNIFQPTLVTSKDLEKAVEQLDGGVVKVDEAPVDESVPPQYRGLMKEVGFGFGYRNISMNKADIQRLMWWDKMLELQPLPANEDFEKLHENGTAVMKELYVPERKREPWRFQKDLETIYKTDFDVAYGDLSSTEDISEYVMNDTAALLVIKDGLVDRRLSRLDGLPNGTFVGSIHNMEGALRERFLSELYWYPEYSQQQFKKGAYVKYKGKLWKNADILPQQIFEMGKFDIGMAKLCALNMAHLRDVACVHVPEGTTIDKPIQVLVVSTSVGDSALPISSPRLQVLIGDKADVTLSQSHVGLARKGFINSVTRVIMGRESRFNHDYIQEAGRDAWHFEQLSVLNAQAANYTYRSASWGAQSSRINVQVVANEKESRTDLRSLLLARQKQLLQTYQTVWHNAKDTYSDSFHRNIVADSATAVWKGRGRLEHMCNGADAKQLCRSLLLNERSKAVSIPVLEMMSPQIKAAHGATVSDLSQDQIIYLRTRGLSDEVARYLMVKGFANEVSNPMVDETAKRRLSRHMDSILSDPSKKKEPVREEVAAPAA